MFGKNPLFRCLIFFAILCYGNFSSAKDMPRYGIFVYSNFCSSAMSGDLYGNRITLRRLIDGDTLIYEYTDGSTHVVVADHLALDPKSGKLSFEIHADGDLNTIVSGKLSSDGDSLTVKGMLFDEEATFTLKLISDFSLPIQRCKE